MENSFVNEQLDNDGYLNFRRDIVDCGKEPKVFMGIGKKKKKAWEDCIRDQVANAKFNEEQAKKELEEARNGGGNTGDGDSSGGGGGNTGGGDSGGGMNKILKYSLFGLGGAALVVIVILVIRKLRK